MFPNTCFPEISLRGYFSLRGLDVWQRKLMFLKPLARGLHPLRNMPLGKLLGGFLLETTS